MPPKQEHQWLGATIPYDPSSHGPARPSNIYVPSAHSPPAMPLQLYERPRAADDFVWERAQGAMADVPGRGFGVVNYEEWEARLATEVVESEEGEEDEQEVSQPLLATVSAFESQDEIIPHPAAGNEGASGTAATVASTYTQSTHSARLRPRVLWNRTLRRTASMTALRYLVAQEKGVEAARALETAPSSSAPQAFTSQDENIIGDKVQPTPTGAEAEESAPPPGLANGSRVILQANFIITKSNPKCGWMDNGNYRSTRFVDPATPTDVKQRYIYRYIDRHPEIFAVSEQGGISPRPEGQD